MKIRRLLALILVFVICSTVLGACNSNGSAENDELCGEWAFLYEPENSVLSLSGNGKAVFKGDRYTYTHDNTFIYLEPSSKGEELKLRYELVENQVHGTRLDLYLPDVYTYRSEGEPNGIVGLWSSDDERSFFEFTDKGTFLEDGYMPGHYTVSEDGKSVKLMYVAINEDTTVYFKIDGNKFNFEYPWPMSRMEK